MLCVILPLLLVAALGVSAQSIGIELANYTDLSGSPTNLTQYNLTDAFSCDVPADGELISDDTKDQINASLANLANNRCFSFHPVFHGNVIAKETIYKTLIYTYAWANHKWRNSPDADDGMFRPTNAYGVQILSEPASQQSVSNAYVAWLIAEIGNSMEANNHFTELTATVYLFNQIYSTVRVLLQAPIVQGNTTAASSTAALKTPLDDTASSPKEENGNITLSKRGSSPYSFDHTLVTRFLYSGGGLVVQGVEPVLMGTLLGMSQAAFKQNGEIRRMVAASPHRDIEAVARSFDSASGKVMSSDVLDAMIDLVEWQYQTARRTGLFARTNGTALKQVGPRGQLNYQPIAAFAVYSPD